MEGTKHTHILSQENLVVRKHHALTAQIDGAMSPARQRRVKTPPRQATSQPTGSSLGKRGRASGDDDTSESGSKERNIKGVQGEVQHQHQRILGETTDSSSSGSKRHAKAAPSSVGGADQQKYSPLSPERALPSGCNGRPDGGRTSNGSSDKVRWSKSSMGNPDVAGVLRR